MDFFLWRTRMLYFPLYWPRLSRFASMTGALGAEKFDMTLFLFLARGIMELLIDQLLSLPCPH